ncbi:unnamed protein product [Brachionus calyciflorus]|uniref:Fringe-like glycosyltransferase domain-containing protein n=1 Tax=Brachionus calyciflorus TaxID=104777 RepID=A0A813X6E5_9BILA|nr:unnamed protein product [Brachionus calyciflorus]
MKKSSIETMRFLQKCYKFMFLSLFAGFICLLNFYMTIDHKQIIEITNFKREFINEKKANTIILNKIKPNKISNATFDSCNSIDSKLCDLVITIKTTKENHETKLKAIIETWFTLVPSKTFIITDEFDEKISQLTNNHLINTTCGKTHNREALSCKLQHELKEFSKHASRWYCHVDDDNYLNIQLLIEILNKLDYQKDWYIGKKSLTSKMRVFYKARHFHFSFATGGAGFCLSHSLFSKLSSYIDDFVKISNAIGLPDDCTLGFIIESLIGVDMIENVNFHSHLEYLGFFNQGNLKDQISLSYNLQMNNYVNIFSNKTSQNDQTK